MGVRTVTELVDTAAVPMVRPLQESDRQRVLTLWENHFGDSVESMFDAAVGDHDRVAGFAGVVNDDLAGFGIAAIGSPEWLEGDYDELDVQPYVSGDLIGTLYQIVVAPNYRGRGIGTRLTRRRLRWLATHDDDIQEIVATCWERENGPDARGIVERFGFEAVDLIEWDNPEDGWCPDCGEGCTCNSVLYVLEAPAFRGGEDGD